MLCMCVFQNVLGVHVYVLFECVHACVHVRLCVYVRHGNLLKMPGEYTCWKKAGVYGSPRPRRVSGGGGGGGANLTMLGHKYTHAGSVCVCCVCRHVHVCRCVCVIKKETRHSHRLEQSVFIIFEHLHFKRKNWLHKYKTSCLQNFFLSDIQKKRRKN